MKEKWVFLLHCAHLIVSLPKLKKTVMITFPCCKINLGLNIVSKRKDGYHDLETVFYPVALTDALSIKRMDEGFPSISDCDLKMTYSIDNIESHNDSQLSKLNNDDNLVVRAYKLLARDYKLPRLHIHLCKRIPSQAGLGGGSSDAAFMIRMLDEYCQLNMGNAEMERYAAMLGADCAFFITAEPSFATGKGEILQPADNETGNLIGYYIAIVNPDIAVSTAEAFSRLTPKKPAKCCRDIVRQPIDTWKDQLVNDFEEPIFAIHPELKAIKEALYKKGAAYAQMSGSGSAIFGIFRERPEGVDKMFPNSFTSVLPL